MSHTQHTRALSLFLPLFFLLFEPRSFSLPIDQKPNMSRRCSLPTPFSTTSNCSTATLRQETPRTITSASLHRLSWCGLMVSNRPRSRRHANVDSDHSLAITPIFLQQLLEQEQLHAQQAHLRRESGSVFPRARCDAVVEHDGDHEGLNSLDFAMCSSMNSTCDVFHV